MNTPTPSETERQSAVSCSALLGVAIAPAGLDYEIVIARDGDGFQIWTPDTTGGIIGSGDTPEFAVRNAILNLARTLGDLAALSPNGEHSNTPKPRA